MEEASFLIFLESPMYLSKTKEISVSKPIIFEKFDNFDSTINLLYCLIKPFSIFNYKLKATV